MLKQILLSMCVTVGLWGFSALAQIEDVDVIQSCEITASQTFKKSTVIECDGDLKFGDGLTIASEEGSLHILTAGQVLFGKDTKLLSTAKSPEVIRILATTAHGHLHITTDVNVEMEYASVAGDYQQFVKTRYGAEVLTFVSSQKLLLEGPEHNISRQ